MTTLKRTNCMIAAIEAAVEEARSTSSAPLDDVEAFVGVLRMKFDANPETLSEQELLETANMLWGFLSQSFVNIRRFFRELDPDSTSPITVTLADGSAFADGSVTAS